MLLLLLLVLFLDDFFTHVYPTQTDLDIICIVSYSLLSEDAFNKCQGLAAVFFVSVW
jgi:hypothetical protein